MTTDVYLYPGHGTDAALHLRTHSALANCTDAEETYYAGGDCLRVRLTSPRPSRGERLLWETMEALSFEDGSVQVGQAAAVLDGESLEAFHAAIGVLFFGSEPALDQPDAMTLARQVTDPAAVALGARIGGGK